MLSLGSVQKDLSHGCRAPTAPFGSTNHPPSAAAISNHSKPNRYKYLEFGENVNLMYQDMHVGWIISRPVGRESSVLVMLSPRLRGPWLAPFSVSHDFWDP